MRRHLTTLRWYEDRLCSLPSRYLLAVTVVCLAGLGALFWSMFQFVDDMAFLLSENEVKAAVLLEIVLLVGSGFWLLSCCVGALVHRYLLRRRGL